MWRLLVVSAVTAALSTHARAQSTESKAPDSPTILVLRFETPGDADNADWIGRAAQEDLATDLTHNTTARIKSPFEPKAFSDYDSALRRAREVHATHVVFGQAQAMDANVRLTGQVLDVASGRPLGTLKITGPRSSLFDLEDALSRQVCAVLPREILKPEMVKALAENPPAPAIRLDDPEPEPIRVFPSYANADYSIPERYDTAPTIVINVNLPSYDDIVPGFAPPVFGGPFGYGPLAYSSLIGSPYAWYGPGYYGPFASSGYPSFGYPFGGLPYGGFVVVNNGFSFRRGAGLRHGDGFGARGRFGRGFGGGVAGTGVAASNGGVVFEFSADGGTGFQGIPANGFRPAVPAGGFSVGIPQTGFQVGGPRFGGMRGPRFGGPAFGNNIRGGSAVR
jgi:TolB-like protein